VPHFTPEKIHRRYNPRRDGQRRRREYPFGRGQRAGGGGASAAAGHLRQTLAARRPVDDPSRRPSAKRLAIADSNGTLFTTRYLPAHPALEDGIYVGNFNGGQATIWLA
jgi:hypothetical protein